MSLLRFAAFTTILALVGLPAPSSGTPGEDVIAIVGGTIIDGNGGPPLADGTVLIRGRRIVAVGPRAAVTVPSGARVIDAVGKFITPGFVDANVHISIYNQGLWTVLFEDRFADVVARAAQAVLKHGVTTVRDSYGQLRPLMAVRDRIKRGELVGPRMLVAGNIVGWGGPWSPTFTGGDGPSTFFEERMTDLITEGSGEELIDLPPEDLRVAFNKYLDLGPDFIKYGGTSHVNNLITFSPRQQAVLVEETHKRGLFAETHATSPEALRIALLAGVDVVQHPEVTKAPIPEDVIALFRERGVICASLTSLALERRSDSARRVDSLRADSTARADSIRTDSLRRAGKKVKELTDSERQRRAAQRRGNVQNQNMRNLIKGGCIIAVATDTYLGTGTDSAEAARKDSAYMPGVATLEAIVALVKHGMTPLQAITAGTKNGALAANGLHEFGTIEAGKLADLVILDADPVADIKNIHQTNTVIRDGRVIDPKTLPSVSVQVESEQTFR